MSSVVRVLVSSVVWGNASVVMSVKVDLGASVVRFSMMVFIHVTHWLDSDMVGGEIIVFFVIGITMSIVSTAIPVGAKGGRSISMREILMETSNMVNGGVVDRCTIVMGSTVVAVVEVVLFLSSGESGHSSDDERSHDV